MLHNLYISPITKCPVYYAENRTKKLTHHTFLYKKTSVPISAYPWA